MGVYTLGIFKHYIVICLDFEGFIWKIFTVGAWINYWFGGIDAI